MRDSQAAAELCAFRHTLPLLAVRDFAARTTIKLSFQEKEIEQIAKSCQVVLDLNKDDGYITVSGFVKFVDKATEKIEKYLQKISCGNTLIYY